MNTRKLRKVLLTLCSALLLVSLSVGMTVAYLTSETDVVKNTFTVGKVVITLDEAQVNEYGQPVTITESEVTDEVTGETTTVKTETVVDQAVAPRVDKNTYKLVPNHTYTKDPTVHIDDASEDCWIFVKVENDISAIESTIATQMSTNGWALVDGEANVYAYNAVVKAGDDKLVFNSFTVNSDAEVENYSTASIKVTAYAVQADGFATSQLAWDATFGK